MGKKPAPLKIPRGRRAAWFTADYLLGRRFEFLDRVTPDITCVGYGSFEHPGHVRLHCADGGKQWIPFKVFYAAIFNGLVQESDKVAFVNPRGKHGTT